MGERVIWAQWNVTKTCCKAPRNAARSEYVKSAMESGKIWQTMSSFFVMSQNETENTISELTDNDEQHKCKHSVRQ
jgi:hypothetical protein